MSEEINVETGVEVAAEVSSPGAEATAAELAAQEAAGREEQAAPQTEPEAEQFEYETPDGKVVLLNKEQADAVQSLLDAEERAEKLEAKIKELEAKPAEKPAEKPGEAKPEEASVAGEQVEPVNWDVVGDELTGMLEEGRSKEIGPALQGIINREVVKSPFIAAAVAQFVERIIADREQGAKTENSLKTFVGAEFPPEEVKAFQTANPWAKSKEAALVGLKAARLEREIATLKAGKPAIEAAARKQGEKETLLRNKARGTLRPVTGKNARPGDAGDLKKGVNLADPDDRAKAAATFIERARASGKEL
jgi:hypothetical protein